MGWNKRTDTNTIGPYRIAEDFQDGTVILRVARKKWHCHGGHDGRKRLKCELPINPGSDYVEYVGETYLYQSGQRYHIKCAAQQGLLRQRLDSE